MIKINLMWFSYKFYILELRKINLFQFLSYATKIYTRLSRKISFLYSIGLLYKYVLEVLYLVKFQSIRRNKRDKIFNTMA